MSDKSTNEFLMKMKKFWYPINIYNNLKKLYFSIVPKGSKAYQFTHSFLNIFLKQLSLFNIYYQEWIRRYDRLSDEDLHVISTQIKEMDNPPYFSIIMPVYNPPEALLHQAIQSVLNQVYPHWELCIADDASTNPEIPAIIQHYTQQDSRVRAIFREENGHISAASNSALELAQHDYLALLDHDDALHPLAMYYAAQMITKHPDSVLIYTDEDKITRGGKRLDPYFKPDFNYELFLSQNMISHLGVYKTEAVRQVGGFREGFEGSQDYDLALRVIENCDIDHIHHIPRPLYHWRIIKESAAHDLNIKPYAIDAGARAISEHLSRRSIHAQVDFLPEVAAYDVAYALPDPLPELTIVVPTLELSEHIVELIETIICRTDYPRLEILLGVAGKIPEEFNHIMKEHQQVIRIIQYENQEDITFAKRVNQCVKAAPADYICLINGHLSGFKPMWLHPLITQAIQPGIGNVAPKLINPKQKRIDSNGLILLPDQPPQHLSRGEEMDNGYFGWAKLTRGYSALSDKCLLFKREQFLSLDGCDETFQSPFYSIVDMQLKFRDSGLRNILRPSVELFVDSTYQKSSDVKMADQQEESEWKILEEKWKYWFQNDPAFNPNLTIIDGGRLLINLSPDHQLAGGYQ